MEDMEIVNIPLYVCIYSNIAKDCNGGDSLDKSTGPSNNSIEIIANC